MGSSSSSQKTAEPFASKVDPGPQSLAHAFWSWFHCSPVPAACMRTERRLFYRERADGLYHVGTYLAAKLLQELLLATVISIMFASFVFYGVQYQGSFVLFW
jgi:hypothetical protein